jgi:DNA-binding response OmpR family regulator
VAARTLHDACEILAGGAGPRIALLDWRTPELRTTSLIRRIRALAPTVQPYVILVTADADADAVLSGLAAGADDYMPIPQVPSALQARLRVGLRALLGQERLRARTEALDAAAAQVRHLQRLLPICTYCRRIHANEQQWQHLDEYLSDHADVRFTHGFCPQCYAEHVQPSLKAS